MTDGEGKVATVELNDPVSECNAVITQTEFGQVCFVACMYVRCSVDIHKKKGIAIQVLILVSLK